MNENDLVCDHVIPIETALNSLNDFMVGQGIVETKAGVMDYVDNYFAVPSNGGTKAAGANLMYAVNFKDEQGYALLAADNRISDDIIAVTEEGSVSLDDFLQADKDLIPSANDDLSVEEYYKLIQSGAIAGTKELVINIACDYAGREILTTSPQKSYKSDYEWTTVKQVPTLMTTLWTQEGKDNVFNKYCPEVGLFWKNKAIAGCVCIAVAQIVAYHEYPSPYVCNGVPIDYKKIKRIYSIYGPRNIETPEVQLMLSNFCYNIGGLCKTKYHSIFNHEYSFAWPTDARIGLQQLGYKNVKLKFDYDENLVLNSLDNGCPVFMSAISGFINGHAWVIDGYIKREYKSQSTGFVSERQTLVHCNWGWGGDCNGYFTSGFFKTTAAVISDGYGAYSEHKYGEWTFNIITYHKPDK